MTNPYAPPEAAVRDVFDVNMTGDLASRGARLGAAILDSLAGFVLMVVPMFAIMIGAMLLGTGSDISRSVIAVAPSLGVLAGGAVWVALTITFMRANGQSIGKKMIGIKMVRTDGSDASLVRLFLVRLVANTALAFIAVYGIVDVLFIFSDSRRCLHDRIADTIVINA